MWNFTTQNILDGHSMVILSEKEMLKPRATAQKMPLSSGVAPEFFLYGLNGPISAEARRVVLYRWLS